MDTPPNGPLLAYTGSCRTPPSIRSASRLQPKRVVPIVRCGVLIFSMTRTHAPAVALARAGRAPIPPWSELPEEPQSEKAAQRSASDDCSGIPIGTTASTPVHDRPLHIRRQPSIYHPSGMDDLHGRKRPSTSRKGASPEKITINSATSTAHRPPSFRRGFTQPHRFIRRRSATSSAEADAVTSRSSAILELAARLQPS